MGKRFSERYGYVTVDRSIQLEKLSADSRRDLNDALYLSLEKMENSHKSVYQVTLGYIWRKWMKQPLSRFWGRESYACAEVRGFIEEKVSKGVWHEVFDLIEFLVPEKPDADAYINNFSQEMIKMLNMVLERTYSGYRMAGGLVVPISSNEEIKEIETASDSDLDTAGTHIKRSLELYSDRKNPDYRNSIKESISAVESVCCSLVGKKESLGASLTTLKGSILKDVHPAFMEGLSKIYGYTSDADGVRHALMNEKNVSQEDARFMLVMCSSFVNYLQEKSRKNS